MIMKPVSDLFVVNRDNCHPQDAQIEISALILAGILDKRVN